MKIETKLPFFPAYAKDILWETQDYDITTFGVFWKMLLLTWVRECRWIKDDENVPWVLKITPNQWKKAKMKLQGKYLVDNKWVIETLFKDMTKAITISRNNKRAANIRHGNIQV